MDQLGLILLRDLLSAGAWSELNYVLEAQRYAGYKQEASQALSEAFGWLRARGLIARDTTQSSDTAFFVTRTGKRGVEESPDSFYATERLQRGSLHPTIERNATPVPDGKVRTRRFRVIEGC